MESYDDYFYYHQALRDHLEQHGFDHWPTTDELTLHVFEIERRLDCLFQALGVQPSPSPTERLRVRFSERGA